MKQPCRIGIVGAGRNTIEKHIPGLLAQPGVKIAGVCNRTPASGAAVAQRFGIPRVYEIWTEAVADPDTDAIVIGSWPDLHARVTLAALAQDKHVLTEARMAATAGEARRMLDAARAKPHLVTQVVPAPFSFGVDATIRRLLAEDGLGELLAVEHHAPSAGFPDPTAPRHWRQDRDRSGFNIQALGIVYEMLMRWVGEAESVLAAGRVFDRVRRDERGAWSVVQVPDHLDVLASLACGAQLHLQQSAVMPRLVGGGTYLFGRRGALRFWNGALYETTPAQSDWRPVVIPPEEAGRWRVEEEFISAIRGREPVRLTTFEDGVKYMEFTEAVQRSLATGRRVALPLALNDD